MFKEYFKKSQRIFLWFISYSLNRVRVHKMKKCSKSFMFSLHCALLSALGMMCHESDAPLVANGHVTAWRRSLTSLEGDVRCDKDYMYVGPSPRVRCVASNQWQPVGGHCARRVWTSGLVSM